MTVPSLGRVLRTAVLMGVLSAVGWAAPAGPLSLHSPDGFVLVTFEATGPRGMRYSVSYRGKTVVGASPLGYARGSP